LVLIHLWVVRFRSTMSAPKRDACTFVTRNPSGSSRINRNPLANFEETLPRIPLQKFEPVSKVVDGEVIGAQPFGEFAPSEGRRDGCWQQCAGRIRGHRCRTAVVAQVVDENASTANTLRNGGDIAVGPVSRHRLRDRGGERFRPNRPAARPEPRRGAPLLPDVLTKLFRLQVLTCSSLAASMTASQGASSPGSRSKISAGRVPSNWSARQPQGCGLVFVRPAGRLLLRR
jgi:hypothetical protein